MSVSKKDKLAENVTPDPLGCERRCRKRDRSKAKEQEMKSGEPTDGGSCADKLVELALNRYRIGRTETDEAFAVELNGPNIALMLGASRDTFRAALSREYRRSYRKVPNCAALTDAITTLQGEAMEKSVEPVFIRVAEIDDKVVIDLGGKDGRAVVVNAGAWEVVERSPVLFRRNKLTGELPMPIGGARLNELRELLNVTEDTWQLACGWLLAAFLPHLPHPILLLGGEQGTGKTSAAKTLVRLIDPSPAPVRSQPREERQWAVSACASWVVAIDNVSFIPDWWSDALCKAVTGDGWIDRTLFTNSEVTVLSFRRVVLLTSIDALPAHLR